MDFSRPPPIPYPFKCPTLLRKLAKELAELFYEGGNHWTKTPEFIPFMVNINYDKRRSEIFRSRFPNRKAYVAWTWPLFVKDARDTLASMLGEPNVSEHMKQEIFKTLKSGE